MKHASIRKTLVLVSACLGFAIASQATQAQDQVFGRWCEPASEHNGNARRSVEFIWTADEDYIARFTSAAGETSIKVLSALPGNIYVEEGNVYGERYRINRSSGKLQLMNKEGVLLTSEIREESDPVSSCF